MLKVLHFEKNLRSLSYIWPHGLHYCIVYAGGPHCIKKETLEIYYSGSTKWLWLRDNECSLMDELEILLSVVIVAQTFNQVPKLTSKASGKYRPPLAFISICLSVHQVSEWPLFIPPFCSVLGTTSSSGEYLTTAANASLRSQGNCSFCYFGICVNAGSMDWHDSQLLLEKSLKPKQ